MKFSYLELFFGALELVPGATHTHVSSGSSGFGLRPDRVAVEFTILGTSAASGARGIIDSDITDTSTEKK